MALIHERLIKVLADLPAIGKNQTFNAPGQKWNFRGIDDVLPAVNELLGRHGVAMLPRVESFEHIASPIEGKKDAQWRFVVIEWTFIAEDGSFIVTSSCGEANDTGDRATQKAWTSAQKIALNMVFSIATKEFSEGDIDHPREDELLQDTGERLVEAPAPGGWPSAETAAAAHVAFQDEIKKLSEAVKKQLGSSKMKTWTEQKGYTWPLTMPQFEEAKAFVAFLVTEEQQGIADEAQAPNQ